MCANTRPFTTLFSFFFFYLILVHFFDPYSCSRMIVFLYFECTYLPTYLPILWPLQALHFFSSYREIDSFFLAFILQRHAHA